MIKSIKEKYIKDKINEEYVYRSRQAALAIIIATFIFSFLHQRDTPIKMTIALSNVLAILTASIRLYSTSLFKSQKISLERAVSNTSILVYINAFLWFIIGICSWVAYKSLNVETLTTFILLNAYGSGSMITLAANRKSLVIYNILILLPQVLYALWEIHNGANLNYLWLCLYAIISLGYVITQSKVILLQQTTRFAAEFDLKKSLLDVEESKRNLEEATIQTFHASRLSSLGEMASGIGHEINNPLTIVTSMSANILTKEPNLTNEVRTKVEKIHKASNRIAKIVKSMKLISNNSDSNEHEIIHISKILDITLDLFDERFKNENIQFTCQNVNDPEIKCNPQQISQIIINLIGNAIDELEKIDEKDRSLEILVDVENSKKYVLISVINSGPLINQETVEKLFQPFFTTKEIGKGTGLGLSISKKLAENNKGSLSYKPFKSRVSFNLELPMA